MSNKFKLIIAGAVILALLYGGCRIGQWSILRHTGTDTVAVKKELQIISIPVAVFFKNDSLIYHIRDTGSVQYVDTGSQHIVYLPTGTPKEVDDMLNDYIGLHKYSDTAINGRDTVTASVEVTRNKVINWNIRSSYYDSTITTTTVLYPKAKTVISFKFSLASNLKKEIGMGVGLEWKTPKERTYEGHVSYLLHAGVLYQAKIGLPIFKL